jgi:hypothetical protein
MKKIACGYDVNNLCDGRGTTEKTQKSWYSIWRREKKKNWELFAKTQHRTLT